MDAHALAITAALESSPDPVASGVGALFDRHHQRLFKLARRLTGNIDDAHDLVQETFLRVARSPHSIPHGLRNEEAWLVRVLINLCRDRWRQSTVRTRAISSGHIDQQPTVDAESHLIARSLVRHALNALRPRRRAVLVLYEIEGVTIPAIARLLGVTPVTVRWHLSVGRRQMRNALGRDSHGC
jgi:RNA polymerase sigma factor (sigma-70 family)